MSLSEIVQSAQGGAAVDNLGQRFGLSPDQAQSVINAVLPAFERGLGSLTQHSPALGGLLGHLGDAMHQASFQDPSAAQTPTAQQGGGAVLGSIFGNSAVIGQIIQHASAETGIPASTIAAMLPTIASIVTGGLAQALQGHGLGGLLNSIGFGKSTAGAAPGSSGPGSLGSLGGLIGDVLGNPQIRDEIGGLLGKLAGMTRAGTPASLTHLANLDALLGEPTRS